MPLLCQSEYNLMGYGNHMKRKRVSRRTPPPSGKHRFYVVTTIKEVDHLYSYDTTLAATTTVEIADWAINEYGVRQGDNIKEVDVYWVWSSPPV